MYTSVQASIPHQVSTAFPETSRYREIAEMSRAFKSQVCPRLKDVNVEHGVVSFSTFGFRQVYVERAFYIGSDLAEHETAFAAVFGNCEHTDSAASFPKSIGRPGLLWTVDVRFCSLIPLREFGGL